MTYKHLKHSSLPGYQIFELIYEGSGYFDYRTSSSLL